MIDNGKEFAGLKELDRGLEMQGYFAHPYPSLERGTNENTNNLLRQFFSNGMGLGIVIRAAVDKVLEVIPKPSL